MQRFLKWLGNRLFPAPPAAQKPTVAAAGPRVTHSVTTAIQSNPARNTSPQQPPQSADKLPLAQPETDVGGRIEGLGPGKNVLIRNKYLREDTGTHETLKIIDDSLLDSGETAGFDPYNTGKFNRSETWQARTWK